MKRLLVLTVLAGTALGLAPAANAGPCVHVHDGNVHAHAECHEYDNARYRGGCAFRTYNDVTPGGLLGGQEQWNGVFYIFAVAEDGAGNPSPTSTIDVKCELFIDGIFAGYEASAGGTGSVAAAADESFSFNASADAVVSVRETVTVDGHTTTTTSNATTEPVIPEAVSGPIDELLTTLNDLINELILEPIDPTICPIIGALAPGLPGVVDINTEGDIDLFGEPFYLCPPY